MQLSWLISRGRRCETGLRSAASKGLLNFDSLWSQVSLHCDVGSILPLLVQLLCILFSGWACLLYTLHSVAMFTCITVVQVKQDLCCECNNKMLCSGEVSTVTGANMEYCDLTKHAFGNAFTFVSFHKLCLSSPSAQLSLRWKGSVAFSREVGSRSSELCPKSFPVFYLL